MAVLNQLLLVLLVRWCWFVSGHGPTLRLAKLRCRRRLSLKPRIGPSNTSGACPDGFCVFGGHRDSCWLLKGLFGTFIYISTQGYSQQKRHRPGSDCLFPKLEG